MRRVRSAGRALESSRDKIPAHRVAELEKVLMDYYGVEEVTEEIVKGASNSSTLKDNEDYVPHSRAVVQHFLEVGLLY